MEGEGEKALFVNSAAASSVEEGDNAFVVHNSALGMEEGTEAEESVFKNLARRKDLSCDLINSASASATIDPEEAEARRWLASIIIETEYYSNLIDGRPREEVYAEFADIWEKQRLAELAEKESGVVHRDPKGEKITVTVRTITSDS